MVYESLYFVNNKQIFEKKETKKYYMTDLKRILENTYCRKYNLKYGIK